MNGHIEAVPAPNPAVLSFYVKIHTLYVMTNIDNRNEIETKTQFVHLPMRLIKVLA